MSLLGGRGKIIAVFEESGTASGGGNVSARNRRFLQRLASERDSDLHCVYEQGAPEVLNRICRFFFRLSFNTYAEIFLLLRNPGVKFVWIDRSTLGVACCLARLWSTSKVVVYFHNDEVQYHRELARCLPTGMMSLRYHWEAILSDASQRLIAMFAHRLVFISPDEMAQIAGSTRVRQRASVCPPSWATSPDATMRQENLHLDSPALLMVGSDFEPNVLGFRWFIEEVLPGIDVRCWVVGRNLEARIPRSEWVDVMGYVQDLTGLYVAADACVVPVFRGAGLKVKLAEALFYGRIVIASQQAAAPFRRLLPDVVRSDLIFEFSDAQEAREAVGRALRTTPSRSSVAAVRAAFSDDTQYESLREAIFA